VISAINSFEASSVVAVLGSDPSRTKAYAAANGISTAYDDMEALPSRRTSAART
jgi:predicted dehydrogenase